MPNTSFAEHISQLFSNGVTSTPHSYQTIYQSYSAPEQDDDDIEYADDESYGLTHSLGSVSGNVQEVNSEMTTVAQYYGQRASYPTIEKHPLINGTYLAGVEIELENLRIRRPTFNYWEAKSDGSLRNGGMEFVFSSPWGGRDIYNAAIEIDGFLFDNNPEETWRCSTHVHVDVRDMTVAQVKKMILAYTVYERVLFRCSGWHRYKNNFCVALGFAQEQLSILSNAWVHDNEMFFQTTVGSWDKYSAINLVPMQSFGSIEFRISEAKWRKGSLIRLVNRFLSLKEIAMSFEGTEEELLDYLLATPIQKVIRKGLPRSLPDAQQDIDIGVKLAHDIISMNKLRRRNIRLVTPNYGDGTRSYEANVFDPGWTHVRNNLRRRLDGQLDFPDNCPNPVNFSWLYEIETLCNNNGVNFDMDWFDPRSNSRQIRELYRDYKREMRGETPRRRRDNSEYQPQIFDIESENIPDFGEIPVAAPRNIEW